jgi:predicted TIM-barrel fold metal-dependent hydrolase
MAAQDVRDTPGLLQWVVIDPTEPETYDQARQMLAEPWCVGIKIHPESHQYPITRHGDAIFNFAAEHNALVLAHSGDPFSKPGDYVPFANAYPNMRLILAHLGHGIGGNPTEQVAAISKSKHGNLYTDTSSANSILPGLIEWAVKEIGAERILFGTDTPLYNVAMHRARIDHAELPSEYKRMILRDNAVKLLALNGRVKA